VSDIALDDNGDIQITGSDLSLTTGVDAIKQYMQQRFRMFYGEWFLDMERGIPYFQQVLKKNPDPVIVDSILKSTIINTPGVLQLTEFNLDTDAATRQLSLSFKAICTAGEVSFEESIP
jgi:hypothetical protein